MMKQSRTKGKCTLPKSWKISNCILVNSYCLTVRARSSFRKLLLQASKSLNETRHTQASEALFQSQSTQSELNFQDTSTLRQRRPATINSQNDSSLLTAANDVTIALKRTHALLEQELEKSTLSLETLDHSSQTLRQLEHQYSAFDVLLRGSKRLIIELEQADKWDRWMIYGGLAIFGLTCLWIVYKRILRGPLGLMMWATGKVFGSGSAVSSVGKPLSSSATKDVGM
jgi:Sec20